MTRKAKANTKAAPVVLKVAEIKKPFTFRVTVREPKYLAVGDVVPYGERDHVVISVNDCCARILPITDGTPKTVTFTPRFGDKPVSFTAPERNAAIAISANSELEIKHRLGANWREKISAVCGVTVAQGREAEVREHSPTERTKRAKRQPAQ